MKEKTDWEARYQEGNTGWDIGEISSPLKAYFDQLTNKEIRILIPGGGNGYEAAYLFDRGFKNVTLLDIAPSPLQAFQKSYPDFPKDQLICQDFFKHREQYDLIVEQTFFCAIDPELRAAYARKVYELLNPSGKLVGLLWSVPLNEDHPPYGGSKKEYHRYFDPYFDYLHFEEAYNSIPPRAGREIFICAKKKVN